LGVIFATSASYAQAGTSADDHFGALACKWLVHHENTTMKTKEDTNQGVGPLPKGKSKPGAPLFKKPDMKEAENEKRDITGQTDTSLRHMKQRLAEVPKKSAGSKA
jgi:hypothetical protein